MATHEAALLEMPPIAYEGERSQGRVITQPWHRLSLGAILLLSALLNGWQLDRLGYSNTYYAAAVRSMMQSWHNFFFASFDPGGFVTIDKPPLGFWFQVLSAKVFGYNGISLVLPQVVAGVLSVWLLYHLVGRVFGRGAGLLAALAMAVTPVAIASDRSNIIDSTLVLFLLLAAWALSQAAETGRLRWLLACAVLAGLAFNVKMLEAYLAVPSFGVAYLLGAPRAWLVRIGHLILAGVVLLAVSLSWAVAVDLTPASQRPWVDSTSTDSELGLAIGYNGLQRLTGMNRFGGRPGGFHGGTRSATSSDQNGAGSAQPNQGGTSQNSPFGLAGASGGFGQPGSPGGFGQGGSMGGFGQNSAPGGSGQGTGSADLIDRFRIGGPPGGGGGPFNTGSVGPLRLLGDDLGGQDSWLLPLALIGLLAAATRRSLRLPLDPQQQGVVLWGAWLLTTAAFFSVAGFFHSYYLVTMAPAVAALVGIGLAALWDDYRRRGWRGWLLPIALLITAGTQVYMLRNYPDWNRWLTPAVLVLSAVAVAVLVPARLRRHGTIRLWAPVAAAVAVVALLLAPTAWAAATVANGDGGMTPSAGPAAARDGGFQIPGGIRLSGDVSIADLVRRDGSDRAGGFGRGGGFGGDGAQTNSGLLRYLDQHQGTTKYLVAMQSSMNAASYIIQTGKLVMSLGGFSGSDPILTLDELKTLIKNNTVRYFYGVGGFGRSNGIGQWVQSACTLVPASAYGGSTVSDDGFPGGTPPMGGFPGGGPQGGAPSGGQQGNGATRMAAGGFGGSFPGFGRGGQALYDCSGAVQ